VELPRDVAVRSGRARACIDRANRLNPNIIEFSKRDSYQSRGHLTVSKVISYRLTLPRTGGTSMSTVALQFLCLLLGIDLFRYITDALAPMTSVAIVRENALLSGDLARMTREQWHTKCRRRPRRGAESLRSSHAVDSVGSNGECRRRRAAGRCLHLDRHLPIK
jgi:hypothetical protein